LSIAYTRALSPRLAECELTHLDRRPIDITRATAEHEAYERILMAAGLTIEPLAPLDDAPDGVFVEDTALILGDHAVITRPTASRVQETWSTAKALARRFTVHHLAAGKLEGGDVITIGHTLYVGLSARTDQLGMESLSALVAPLGYTVMPVTVRGCLHLKTAATYAGQDGAGAPVLVFNPDWIDPAVFSAVTPMAVATGEAPAANTLRIGETLVIPAGNPRTRDALAARGFRVVELDIAELQKAEAGLTCSSLIGG
jgi:dimethylargininase